MFDRMTSSKCSVTVKIVIPGKSQLDHLIATLARDASAARERKIWDLEIPTYSYVENSVFLKAIEYPGAKAAFVCNDLSGLRDHEKYQSPHKNWEQRYNAAVIVPIARREKPELEGLVGFLCIDNQWGRFPARLSIKIASSVAKQIYVAIRWYEERKGKEKPDGFATGFRIRPGKIFGKRVNVLVAEGGVDQEEFVARVYEAFGPGLQSGRGGSVRTIGWGQGATRNLA